MVELSTYDYCSWLDHHIFKDTSLSETGYNFVYPLTADGGTYTSISYTTAISGGPFYDYCYQDFCFEKFSLTPLNTYCITNVSFVLSAIDESAAKIIRLIYNFNDGSEQVIKNYNYLTVQQFSLKDEIVSHLFYPTEKFVTTYYPSITALYEDGCRSVVTCVINTYKCGIFNIFENVALLDAAQQKTAQNIVLTLEDKKRFQLFTNLLDLTATVFTKIDQVSATTIVSEDILTIVQASSARIQFLNPVSVDPIIYEYIEGPGINLTPDLLVLAPEDLINSLSGDIILTEGGAPYNLGDGIIVTTGFLRDEAVE